MTRSIVEYFIWIYFTFSWAQMMGFYSVLITLIGLRLVTCQGQHQHCYDESGESDCFYWKLGGMCQQPGYRSSMYQMCRKTCNLCPNIFVRSYVVPTKKVPYKACRDTQTGCPRWKRYCKAGNQYHDFMMKHCKRVWGTKNFMKLSFLLID